MKDGTGVVPVVEETAMGEERTYLVELWQADGVEVHPGGWQLVERGDEGNTRFVEDLSLTPEPERLPEAKASVEAMVGPCVWLDRDPVRVGPWRVTSAVGIPANAA
jgi:hypothetical protein